MQGAVITASEALAQGLRPEQLRAVAAWSFDAAAAEHLDGPRQGRLRRQGKALMRVAEALQALRNRRLFLLLGGVA